MSVYSPKAKAAPKTPPSSGSATPDRWTRPSTPIGAAMTAEQIKAEAASRAMNASGLSASERKAYAARVEAGLRAEAEQAEQAQAAAAVAAEASAERARIAGVVKTGADTGRPMQAARLALMTALDPAGAKALLATMPTDAAADPAALTMPDAIGAFGTPAAMAERRRIAAILGHAEAEGRFQTATALAFETALDPAQAVAAMMAAPRQVARIEKSLAERSREAGEFGADLSGGAGRSRGERIDSMWSNAVAAANASIGAVPSGPTADAVPPNPSITADERAALRGAAGAVGAALTDLARG